MLYKASNIIIIKINFSDLKSLYACKLSKKNYTTKNKNDSGLYLMKTASKQYFKKNFIAAH